MYVYIPFSFGSSQNCGDAGKMKCVCALPVGLPVAEVLFKIATCE